MALKATVNFSESNEPIAAVLVNVWVDQVHRGEVALGGDVRSYVIENLNHNQNVWVTATYVDAAGNRSASERLEFVATDSFAPAPPTVTVASVEQV
ncbi:MAG: hypothetical protein E6R03_15945 [Hyphomicrobiaceae bacterium]|nr:MAG: hypothetical protein E6R03_15945 [Hyphomicrobiaceae bacterium]